jgi:hypothetical protein
LTFDVERSSRSFVNNSEQSAADLVDGFAERSVEHLLWAEMLVSALSSQSSLSTSLEVQYLLARTLCGRDVLKGAGKILESQSVPALQDVQGEEAMSNLLDTLLTRREAFKVGASLVSAYWFLPLLEPTNVYAQSKVNPRGSARFVIFVMLEGGQSHVDSWTSRRELDPPELRHPRDRAGREMADGALSAAHETARALLADPFDGSLGQRALPRAVLRAVRAHDYD